jgi:hypothetical protein
VLYVWRVAQPCVSVSVSVYAARKLKRCSQGRLSVVLFCVWQETTRVELVAEDQLPARMRSKVIIEGEDEVHGAKIKLTLTHAALHVSTEASSSGKSVDELCAALDALDVKEARAALAGGKLQVAGVSLAADSQVFFTLGALLAASKTPL